MSNSLNVRLVNMVTDIAQGDNASTVIIELLDENKLIIPTLNGRSALINFINKQNEIQYQFSTFVFDSRVEFNVDTVIPHGVYNVEVRINFDDSTYVFPSSVNYTLRINKSANEFYNVAITENGVEAVSNAVYQKMLAEIPEILEHPSDKDNPHEVTKGQVGLGNVDNVKQATKEEFNTHTASESNPHSVTKSQVGLGSVDNVKQATKAEFDTHNTDTTKHITASERTVWNGKVDKVSGKVLSSNDYTNSEKTKLSGIETGAQANTVTSVSGKTGSVNITKSDVGLGSVSNYGVATQAEAEAGTSTAKYMTPQRTKQAIEELAPAGGGGIDFEDLTGSISLFRAEMDYIQERKTRIYRHGKIVHIHIEFDTIDHSYSERVAIVTIPLEGYGQPDFNGLDIAVMGMNLTDNSPIVFEIGGRARNSNVQIYSPAGIPAESTFSISASILLDEV